MDAARRTEDEKNRIPTIASAHRSRSSALPSLGAKGDVAKYAKSKRAIAYLVNNEAPLRVFLDDPAVPIDNNTAEQKMRRVALGRNNILFAGSANGGKALRILYSLVATCEQHRINPQAYLEAAFAEAISGDNATEWLPTVWFDRVRTKRDVEHPPRDPVTNQPADDVA